jgi:itaconyl-CoA hydratase
MQDGWWFGDAVAGRSIVHPGARTIGADEHVWLAWMTVNASDLHGNADRAASGPFGRPVVLGALTAAIVIGLATPGGQGLIPSADGGTGWRAIRLGRPVFAGDTLRAVSEVHASQPDGDGGFVERTIRGLSQSDEVVVTIEETCYVELQPW